MGISQSRVDVINIPASQVEPAEQIDEMIQWLIATGYPRQFTPTPALKPNFFSRQRIPAELKELKQILKRKLLYSRDCSRTLNYLTEMAQYNDSYNAFRIAIDVIIQTRQIWHLRPESLGFLLLLSTKNPTKFNELLQKLTEWCLSEKKLYLKAHHIDSVIACLIQQQKLPDDLIDELERFAYKNKNTYQVSINLLRRTHIREIHASANAKQLLHHDIPHALEIRIRSMQLLTQEFPILQDQTLLNQFLQALVGFMIEFHDYKQSHNAEFTSSEEETAATVSRWLCESLAIERNPYLKPFIHYMANQIIVLGTTVVFGAGQRMLDLSSLFSLFQTAAEESHIAIGHRSNLDLIKTIQTISLITGVVDKVPAAFPGIVFRQERDPQLATFPVIQRIYPDSLFEKFFQAGEFLSYFGNEHVISSSDKQAFFIAMAAHLCMRVELGKKSHPHDVPQFIEFISTARIIETSESERSFLTWYEQTCQTMQISGIIDSLFFESIHEEILFSEGQHEALNTVTKKLLLQGFPLQATGSSQWLINPAFAEIDARNLFLLHQFYDRLTPSDKKQLIHELLLCIIHQAGVLYEKQAAYIDSVSHRPSPMRDIVIQPKKHLRRQRFFVDAPITSDRHPIISLPSTPALLDTPTTPISLTQT